MGKKKRLKTARAVNPNIGIRVWYRKHIQQLVERFKRSVMRKVVAKYRKDMDAIRLQDAIDALRDEWTETFEKEGEALSGKFLRRIDATSRNAIKRSLAEVGFNIDWSGDKAVINVLNSIRQTQVDLIRSIPQQELDAVSGIVQRGVQVGRDIAYIQKELARRFAITGKRARMIAIDQTQKATHAINRTRYLQAGIKEAVWIHIAGRKTSRATHVAMHGRRFRLDGEEAGLYDREVNERIMPGQLVNCRCSCRPVIPDNFFDV